MAADGLTAARTASLSARRVAVVPLPTRPGRAAAAAAGCCARWRATYRVLGNAPWYHRVFAVLVLVQVVVLVADRLVLVLANVPDYSSRPNPEAAYRQAAWNCVVVWVTGAFAAYFGIHAIITCNPFELLTFFLTSVALAVRNVVAVGQCAADPAAGVDSGESVACYSLLAASSALCVVTIVMVRYLYDDLLWLKYKALGADVKTRADYRRYEMFVSVVKLDLQFSVLTLLTGLVFFTFDAVVAHVATGINVALFLVELAWERAGVWAVQHEDAAAMYAFWGLSIFLPAFIVNVAAQWRVLLQYAVLDDAGTVWATITTFAAVAVLNRAATVAMSVLLYRRFGRDSYAGLRRLLASGDAITQFDAARRPGGRVQRRREASVIINPMAAAARPDDVVEVLGSDGAAEEDLAPDAPPTAYLDAIDRYIRRESTAAALRASASAGGPGAASLAAAAAAAAAADADADAGAGADAPAPPAARTPAPTLVVTPDAPPPRSSAPAPAPGVSFAGVPPEVGTVRTNPLYAAAPAGPAPLPRSNRVAAALGATAGAAGGARPLA